MTRKPDKGPTKAVTIQDVPSEFADMFNFLVANQRHDGEKQKDAKVRMFVHMVCETYKVQFSDSPDAIEDYKKYYKRHQELLARLAEPS